MAHFSSELSLGLEAWEGTWKAPRPPGGDLISRSSLRCFLGDFGMRLNWDCPETPNVNFGLIKGVVLQLAKSGLNGIIKRVSY